MSSDRATDIIQDTLLTVFDLRRLTSSLLETNTSSNTSVVVSCGVSMNTRSLRVINGISSFAWVNMRSRYICYIKQVTSIILSVLP